VEKKVIASGVGKDKVLTHGFDVFHEFGSVQGVELVATAFGSSSPSSAKVVYRNIPNEALYLAAACEAETYTINLLWTWT
jgi:hypothetical protein